MDPAYTHVDHLFWRYSIYAEQKRALIRGSAVRVTALRPTRKQQEIGCDRCGERHQANRYPDCNAQTHVIPADTLEPSQLWMISDGQIDPTIVVDISRGILESSRDRHGTVLLIPFK